MHSFLRTTYHVLRTPKLCPRSGQSLVEILVAIAVGIILVVGALAMIAPTLKTSGDVTRLQVSSGLGKELFDNLRALSERDWHALRYLSTSSVNQYHVIASTSPFSVATGTEPVLVATTTYTRYFYLDDVYRNASGKIDASGNSRDPSSKKATIVHGFGSTTATMTGYLTRTLGNVFTQTDWSAGGNQDGPVSATTTNAKFATSSNINYTTSTGAMVIQGF